MQPSGMSQHDLTRLFEQQKQRAFDASNYVQQHWSKMAAALEAEWQRDQFLSLRSREQIEARITAALNAARTESNTPFLDDSVWMTQLRQVRMQFMMRWIWQDANQLISLDQLTQELSDFADLSIIAAVDQAYQSLQPRYGTPIGEDGQPQHLIVIGMGKLGAQELNLSSDIDLIFLFDENGETDGVALDRYPPSRSRPRRISVQEMMVQWGQAVIRLLDQVTPDGFVWRVDMRLRPWGDGSPLVMSYAGLERYLEQHGRDWERYAWIKARAITGGHAGELVMQMVQPFIYRRYVDYSVFESLREMKAMIEREVARKQGQRNVKLSAGGIREIEFIVQSFQLIYGGQISSLRVRPCLTALHTLVRLSLITETVAARLDAAYRLLRRVEHGIQALDDQQTQTLPVQTEMLDRLARAVGFDNGEMLTAELEMTCQWVHTVFADTIVLRRESENISQAESTFSEHDLAPEQQAQLERFRASRLVQKLPTDAAKRLAAFWQPFWRALGQIEQPNVAFERVLPLIEAVLRRSVYLVMLLETPGALVRLLKMLAVSPWIAEELTRYPVLLDEFLEEDRNQLPDKQSLDEGLRQALLRVEPDDIEGQMRTLRLFKKSQVLQVAAADVLADRPLMKVSDALTWLAETVLAHSVQRVLMPLVQRHGWPKRADGNRANGHHCGFAIAGYGKLGGIELGYGSDLDLVFLHQVDELAETDGQRPISGQEFVVRLAQKLTTLLTTQTLDGRVYEIDTRLRPAGEAGLLVTSLTAFAQYQQKDAWLWEKQALVRARAVAGDPSVCAEFEAIRQHVLTQPRDLTTVQTELTAMRQKMIDHLSSTPAEQQAGLFHLKHDVGGMVDIEFMAQYGVLAFAARDQQLAVWSDNVRILAAMAAAGILGQADADSLTASYLQLRGESHWRALSQQSAQVAAAPWQRLREGVSAQWQALLGQSLVPR